MEISTVIDNSDILKFDYVVQDCGRTYKQSPGGAPCTTQSTIIHKTAKAKHYYSQRYQAAADVGATSGVWAAPGVAAAVVGAGGLEKGAPDSAAIEGEIIYTPPRGFTKGSLGRASVAVGFSGSIPVVDLLGPCPIYRTSLIPIVIEGQKTRDAQ